MLLDLFLKGGPIMWPILLLSIVTAGVVLERILFLASERLRRKPHDIEKVLSLAEHQQLDQAAQQGAHSSDPIARVLAHGLAHRDVSLSNALVQAAGRELDRYNRGLVVLDTAVTLGPLLGLLGTVIGMIQAFGIVGGADLAGQQTAITGGIAESLIAVTFGLGVAIVAIVPLNYLSAQLESTRRQLEDATNHLELIVGKFRATPSP